MKALMQLSRLRPVICQLFPHDLQDIQAAATAVGVYNIKVPHNTVTNGNPPPPRGAGQTPCEVTDGTA